MSRPATATSALDATGATTATNATDTTRATDFAVSANNFQDERKGASVETGLAMTDAPAPASALHAFIADQRVPLARALCRLHGEYGRATSWALTLSLARHDTLPSATIALAHDVLDLLTFDDLNADHDPTVFAVPGQPEPFFQEELHRLREAMQGALVASGTEHGTESH